ncbi:hypothetical protein DXG01_012299 [Tephrocybe rancida]|nr:hypothetical protein DXG01_012299 [Tephrocybe rancida]
MFDDPEQQEQGQRRNKGRPRVGESPEAQQKALTHPEAHHISAERAGNDKRHPRTDDDDVHVHRRPPRSNVQHMATPPEWMTTTCMSASICPTNPPQQHQHHAEKHGYPPEQCGVLTHIPLTPH